MNFGNDQSEFFEVELNVIPMIDVLFCLLMFLMLTTSFSQAGGIKVNLPSAKGATSESAQQSILITVTKDGQVFGDSGPIQSANFEQILRDKVAAGSAPVLVIQADKSVNHGAVVELMASAHRAGIQKLAVSAKDGE